ARWYGFTAVNRADAAGRAGGDGGHQCGKERGNSRGANPLDRRREIAEGIGGFQGEADGGIAREKCVAAEKLVDRKIIYIKSTKAFANHCERLCVLMAVIARLIGRISCCRSQVR